MNKKLLDKFERKVDSPYYQDHWILILNHNSWIEIVKKENKSWAAHYYHGGQYRELPLGRISLETAKIKALEFAQKMATQDLEKLQNTINELEKFLEEFDQVPPPCSWCGVIVEEVFVGGFTYEDAEFCSLDCQRAYQKIWGKHEKN